MESKGDKFKSILEGKIIDVNNLRTAILAELGNSGLDATQLAISKGKIETIFAENKNKETVIDEIANEFAALAVDDTEKTTKENLKALYTLEYQQAAERYENIYKAIWTNFSYMTAVTGAILVFGSSFYPNARLIAFLACLPLIFWYFISFIPLNRYGYKASERLGEIERLLNNNFHTKLSHYKNFGNKPKGLWNFFFLPRVGPIMLAFAIMLLAFSVIFGYQYFFDRSPLLEANELTVTKRLAERLYPTILSEETPRQASLSANNSNITNLANTNSSTSNSVLPQPGSPANTIKSIPCEQSEIQDAKLEIDKVVQAKLSKKTKKLLCEFHESGTNSASKELQGSLANDFNKIIEGYWVCNNPIFKEKCSEKPEYKGLYSDADSTEKLMLANRRVLEKEYPENVNSLFVSPWFILAFLPFVGFILFSVAYEFNEQILNSIRGKQEKIRLNLYSICNGNLTEIRLLLFKEEHLKILFSQVTSLESNDDQIVEAMKWIKEKDSNETINKDNGNSEKSVLQVEIGLLLDLLPLTDSSFDINSIKWEDQNSSSKLIAFKKENQTISLEKLDYGKLKNMHKAE